jgi:hypothetical protein
MMNTSHIARMSYPSHVSFAIFVLRKCIQKLDVISVRRIVTIGELRECSLYTNDVTVTCFEKQLELPIQTSTYATHVLNCSGML